MEGVALIDEIETHLHLELQKKNSSDFDNPFSKYTIYCYHVFLFFFLSSFPLSPVLLFSFSLLLFFPSFFSFFFFFSLLFFFSSLFLLFSSFFFFFFFFFSPLFFFPFFFFFFFLFLFLPILINLFPNIQFIVTTHSPFILSSVNNVVIYDLENKTLVENGMKNLPYEGIVEGYFKADRLSEELRKNFSRYKVLVSKAELSDEEYEEIDRLEYYLDEIPDYLAKESVSLAFPFRCTVGVHR